MNPGDKTQLNYGNKGQGQRPPYNANGYNNGGYNNGGYNNGGFNNGGYNNGGYNNGGYNNGGYNSGGYNNGGYNSGGYNSGGYNNGGYGPQQPYGRNGGYNNGYNNPGNNGNKKGGSNLSRILVIAIIALVVVLAGVGVVVKVVLDKKAEAEQMRKDSIAVAEYTQMVAATMERNRVDSLMRYFQSPDLSVCQMHGFVKQMTMTWVTEGASRTVFVFNFDKDGNLTNATQESNGHSHTIQVYKNNGGIRSLTIKGKDYNGDVWSEESFKTTFSFYYDKSLRLSTIVQDSDGWEFGSKYKYVFSNFNSHGLPCTASYSGSCESEGDKTEVSSVETIAYSDYDDNDNWLKAKWSGKITCKNYSVGMYTDYEFQGSDTSDLVENVTRSITYYTREEIFGDR